MFFVNTSVACSSATRMRVLFMCGEPLFLSRKGASRQTSSRWRHGSIFSATRHSSHSASAELESRPRKAQGVALAFALGGEPPQQMTAQVFPRPGYRGTSRSSLVRAS